MWNTSAPVTAVVMIYFGHDGVLERFVDSMQKFMEKSLATNLDGYYSEPEYWSAVVIVSGRERVEKHMSSWRCRRSKRKGIV